MAYVSHHREGRVSGWERVKSWWGHVGFMQIESNSTDHFMKPDKWLKILVLLRTLFSSHFLLFYFDYGNCVFVPFSQWKVQTFVHHWVNKLENQYLCLKFDFGVVVQWITNSSFTIQTDVSIVRQSSVNTRIAIWTQYRSHNILQDEVRL